VITIGKFNLMRRNSIFLHIIISIVILTIIVFLAFFSSMCLPQKKCKDYEVAVSIGNRIVKAIQEFKNREGYFPNDLNVVLTDGIQGKYPNMFKNDIWGYSYVYKITENHTNFFLYSIGVNGQDESGKGDDIIINPNNTNFSQALYCN